ncbi:MAG TPA: tripartite tricarboxylate transporter substrate binding protein [Burkholderiaceae bacterium]|nr:tripartite tricarboxylate transporter substrate binding protein [Burkholderiaceae bacterium]
MTPQRRRFTAALAAMAIGPAFGAARAQSVGGYPNRPITLWIPWPAGGATDLTLRVLAELAAPLLGQKIIVENRSGAGGTLAMPVLQQAAPDGYTIAQMPQTVFRAPWVQKLSWNPIRDTTAIIQVSGVTFGIVVPASSPFHSLEDLLQYAQKHPGELTVSTNGVGTTPHLVMDDLMARRRATYVHVPYKGTAEQMVAVASGQVMVGVNSNGFAPFVDMGKLRLLVTFGEQRTKRWPQVPTLTELGYGIVATSPYGLAGPRGLPDAVVRTLHHAFKTAMFEPAHIAELARYDQELAYLGPEDYAQAMREAYQAERRVVERLGLARAN